ncbi:hypothetical protein CRX72_26990 [Pantoea sp. BRM17]|nr:hypothetical protein CRX72_26990 [Pantoea sp. BRM17]
MRKRFCSPCSFSTSTHAPKKTLPSCVLGVALATMGGGGGDGNGSSTSTTTATVPGK